MPRVYVRATRNSGVSFGTIGFLAYAFGWLMIAMFVVTAVIAVAAVAIAAVLLALLVAAVDAFIHRDGGAFARHSSAWGRRLDGRRGARPSEESDDPARPITQARYSNRR